MFNSKKPVLAKEDTLDKIYAWYLDSSRNKLTPVQEEQRQRYEAMWALLCNYHSVEQAIPLMMSRFNISRAQAYRDANATMRLFGDINNSSKEGMRSILYEYAMKCFQLAASQRPPDIKEMNKSIANMIKLKGLDREDPDAPNFEELQSHVFNLVYDPKQLNVPTVEDIEEKIQEFFRKKKRKSVFDEDAQIVEDEPNGSKDSPLQ